VQPVAKYSRETLSRHELSLHGKSVVGIAVGFLLLLAVSLAVSPQSLGAQDLANTSRQASGLGIVSIGQTLAILTGGIDLSVGSTMTLVHLVVIGEMNGDPSRAPGVVLAGLAIGLSIGLVNGLGVTKGRIDPLVMTLCTGFIVRSVALIYTGGSPRGVLAPAFREIGRQRIFGLVSWSTLLWLGLSMIMILVLKRTVFGARMHLLGANRDAAIASGVSADRTLIAVYALAGLFASIAGITLTTEMSAASMNLGDPYLLNSIAVVVLGGTLFVGGIGGVEGTIFGALVLVVLNSLLQKAGIVNWGQFVFQALAILAVAMLYSKKVRT
jgi:ribose transport system permease protein